MLQFEYEFLSHPKILSGACSLESIAGELETNNACKPLIIADRQAVPQKMNQVLLRAFDDSDCLIGGVFDKVDGYAGISLAKQAAELFLIRGCDSLISLGGPLAADLARAVNIMVCADSPDLSCFFNGTALPQRLFPFVLVPASGFEGTGAGNTMTLDHQRLFAEILAPDIIAIDKRMLCRQSAIQAAQSAAIAADNAWSAFCDPKPGPISHAFVHTALRLMNQSIDDVLQSPGKHPHSLTMANGAVAAAIAAANAAAGTVSELCWQLAKITNLSRGMLTALFAPVNLARFSEKNGPPAPELLLALAGMDLYSSTPADQRHEKGMAMLADFFDKVRKTMGRDLKSLQIPFYIVRQACENIDPGSGVSAADALDLADRAWKGAAL
jgi:alcohol dehydrogenase class IV